MSQGVDTIMTTGGNDSGNAGSKSSENNDGNGGAPGGGKPMCHVCKRRHSGPCWEPCPLCNIRHHRRSACPTTVAQQQQRMAALEQKNAQMLVEMQQMRAVAQAGSSFAGPYGYGAPLPPPQPFYPSFPWQPQQAMPPMGTGFYPYQGVQYPPSFPPPSPFGELAIGVPQGMPSDAFNRVGRSSGQAPRRGGLPWNNKGRGSRRSEKKADGKDEKKKGEEKKVEKEKPKEKAGDILAAEPSGVRKPGKNRERNARRREKLRARKEQKDVDEGGKGEEEAEMSGVEDTSKPESQPSGPPQTLESEQQRAGDDVTLAAESQGQEASLGAVTINAADPAPPPASHQATDETAPERSLLDMAFPSFFVPGDDYNCDLERGL